mmetsp:Transcript_16211/g.50143  ORF Transcript_16211/g.50143 Transcript_16211/m.50143 type:complete len:345 (-) Transcript_16211:254-1288(-)
MSAAAIFVVGLAAAAESECRVVPVASVPRRAHHRAFDALGPLDAAPAGCDLVNIPELVAGPKKGDDDKRACKGWLDALAAEDVVLSLGSNNEFGFEEQMLGCAPRSHVATLDCTLKNDDAFNKPKTPRVSFHPFCVGAEPRNKFRNWTTVADMALAAAAAAAPGTRGAARVGFLKADVEGFEWSVLPDVLRAPVERLPRQIAVEIHLATHCHLSVPGYTAGPKRCVKVAPAASLQALRASMKARGYLMVDRNDNPWCGHCSEVLFALEGSAGVPLRRQEDQVWYVPAESASIGPSETPRGGAVTNTTLSRGVQLIGAVCVLLAVFYCTLIDPNNEPKPAAPQPT